MDKDLSHWRIYQSYQFTNDYNGRTPVNEAGEKIAPIGYDKNLYNVFSIIEEKGEPVLHISGETYGCVISNESYRNYHLRLRSTMVKSVGFRVRTKLSILVCFTTQLVNRV